MARFFGPVAVIDIETTGIFPFRHDRVIEVAAVVINGDGIIDREFVTLVNPSRDIGPSSIHGLTSEDILHAPQFREIAGHLLDVLDGCIAIAGHNVRFDRQFLECEFSRMEHPLPDCFSLCTLNLAGGGRLADCCNDFGIPFDGVAHHALADARATARLLIKLLADSSQVISNRDDALPILWPKVQRTAKQPMTRDESRRRNAEPPTFLQRLLGRVHEQGSPLASDGSVMAYAALLDRVLEDRRVDDSEADALQDAAVRWGLSGDQIGVVHRDYLKQLAVAAVADGIVTETERRDLNLVSRLLGQDSQNLDAILSEAVAKLVGTRVTSSQAEDSDGSLSGKRVCFTGELQCRRNGSLLSREEAEGFATAAGLTVVDSVTKKLELLVVADPHTLSGKAKKARQYGIRIMHEPVFWRAIGVSVE